MKSVFIAALFFASFSAISFGQQIDLGSWNIINLKYSVNNYWSGFGEAQVRY
jgi:hypothetical protein